MFDFLDKLRAKPVYIRRRIAIGTTFVLSFIIASVCWTSWNSNPIIASQQLALESRSPWSVVGRTLDDMKAGMTNSFASLGVNLKEMLTSNIAAVGGATSTVTTPPNDVSEQGTMIVVPDEPTPMNSLVTPSVEKPQQNEKSQDKSKAQ